ncbi:hypothetical protein [Glaciimonas sp. PAMC28666]|uniref:hypothetical protein n=1 Tax=Glaciimonas sp. PAMC28666 TaxID=2807626 RepID=UPI0019659F83|nr:hypothetical protein [Glaciimonas sp. PAMC28666]QRX85028.1 hypothetical protein JQN73_17105 [Glaciimonas sp. PAMC28666]
MSLTACGIFTPTPAPRGEVQGAPVSPAEVAQSDVNRVATLAMRDNLDSLYRLLDKLYRRNPAEWKKTASSREEAIKHVRSAIEARQSWPDLQGKHDIAALSLALDPGFQGDRAAAFIAATADMIITAHGGKTTFYLIDGLNAQFLYNAARNIEVATWILSSRRNSAGQLLLLSNDISEQEHNLSFEREFGKVIGRIDLLAVVITEKYRRAGISYVQNLVGGTFLQFLPVR